MIAKLTDDLALMAPPGGYLFGQTLDLIPYDYDPDPPE